MMEACNHFVTEDDVLQAFKRLGLEGNFALVMRLEGNRIRVALQYDKDELECINKGLGPEAHDDNVSNHVHDARGASGWSINDVLTGI
ncbi:hypothetical protein VKT23_012207 [Stygiomarasmius scandens]|uniref:Uncharacterized protein n=1 Tax=Marasmiellus scandens TaxID=2682957 RepID=A0ABR1JAW9_9AGAR